MSQIIRQVVNKHPGETTYWKNNKIITITVYKSTSCFNLDGLCLLIAMCTVFCSCEVEMIDKSFLKGTHVVARCGDSSKL